VRVVVDANENRIWISRSLASFKDATIPTITLVLQNLSTYKYYIGYSHTYAPLLSYLYLGGVALPGSKFGLSALKMNLD
jgi:hypothetical protein